MSIGLDHYDRNARLKPALIVMLPLTLALAAIAPDAILGWSGAVALLLQAGGTYLLAQIVGDTGKRREPDLFSRAGGRPTETMLSHSGAPNQTVRRMRHEKMSALLPEVQMPCPDD